MIAWDDSWWRPGVSMPEPENEPIERELERVIAAVHEKEAGVAPLEQVVDAEARGHPAESRGETGAEPEAKRRFRTEENREHEGRDQREDQRTAEDERLVAALDLLVAESGGPLPAPLKKNRIPQAAEYECRHGSEHDRPVVQITHRSPPRSLAPVFSCCCWRVWLRREAGRNRRAAGARPNRTGRRRDRCGRASRRLPWSSARIAPARVDRCPPAAARPPP